MKKHLLFLGAPGAGKGTQAELLHRVYRKLRTKEYVKDLVLLQQVNLTLMKQKHLNLH